MRFKGPRARSHIADLLRMRSVQPRAIAYIAAQVRVSLHLCYMFMDTWIGSLCIVECHNMGSGR